MPCAAWIDERHLPPLGLTNYWGYNPVAPVRARPAAGARRLGGGARRGGGAAGGRHRRAARRGAEPHRRGRPARARPCRCAASTTPPITALLPDDPRALINDTGCGNTLALDRPPVLRLAMDALRDLGAARRAWTGSGSTSPPRWAGAPDGFDPAAPLLAAMAQDPVLRGRAIIAEPWDIGPGGYRLGAFPAGWGEWNDRYPRHRAPVLARRCAACWASWRPGSPAAPTCSRPPRPVSRSINFVTAHDGFTLADLVAYTAKHNDANGEANRDGTDNNLSWNNGVGGPERRPGDPRRPRRATCGRCWRRCCSRAARRCCRWATRPGAPSTATTTPMRRTTRCPGSTGTAMDGDLLAFTAASGAGAARLPGAARPGGAHRRGGGRVGRAGRGLVRRRRPGDVAGALGGLRRTARWSPRSTPRPRATEAADRVLVALHGGGGAGAGDAAGAAARLRLARAGRQRGTRHARKRPRPTRWRWRRARSCCCARCRRRGAASPTPARRSGGWPPPPASPRAGGTSKADTTRRSDDTRRALLRGHAPARRHAGRGHRQPRPPVRRSRQRRCRPRWWCARAKRGDLRLGPSLRDGRAAADDRGRGRPPDQLLDIARGTRRCRAGRRPGRAHPADQAHRAAAAAGRPLPAAASMARRRSAT